MAKQLIIKGIESCIQCPHNRPKMSDCGEYECDHCEPMDKEFINASIIPDWCPLEESQP